MSVGHLHATNVFDGITQSLVANHGWREPAPDGGLYIRPIHGDHRRCYWNLAAVVGTTWRLYLNPFGPFAWPVIKMRPAV